MFSFLLQWSLKQPSLEPEVKAGSSRALCVACRQGTDLETTLFRSHHPSYQRCKASEFSMPTMFIQDVRVILSDEISAPVPISSEY